MITITNPADCCGCTACVNVCSHGAIGMEPDGLGFLYPVVDQGKCVDCGLCEKVCAFHARYDTRLNLAKPLVYAARHKEMKEIESSRSGAAFIALSDWVLDQGGVVYGAGYGEHFKVVHKRALTKESRDEFRGSKYVQSDLGVIFKSVKADLKSGMLVLFSGTPCQTSGLASFVGNVLRDRLYLVDIVCHGVPGPRVWDAYLSHLERKYGEPINGVNFRNKQMFGWTAHKETFVRSGIECKEEGFTYLFYKHIMFRHSCEKCYFCNTRRPSDVTIADFWGWQKAVPGFNADDKGCSLVLVNTGKGKDWFDAIAGGMTVVPVDLKDCLQPNLRHPSIVDKKKRMDFERNFKTKSFSYVMRRYGNTGWRYRVEWMWKNTKRLIKRIIGR